MAIYHVSNGTAKRMDGAGDGSLYAPVTSIATPENGSTASKAYAVGEMFIRDGKLCTCTTAISSGGSFAKGTNYSEGSVGEVLSELNSKTTVNASSTYNSDYISSNSPTPVCRGYRHSMVKEVQLLFTFKNNITIPANGVLFSLGSGFAPTEVATTYIHGFIHPGASDYIVPILIASDGKVNNMRAFTTGNGTHIYCQGTIVYL